MVPLPYSDGFLFVNYFSICNAVRYLQRQQKDCPVDEVELHGNMLMYYTGIYKENVIKGGRTYMDFLHRSANNQPQSARTNGSQSAGLSNVERVKNVVDNQPKWMRITFVVLLFSATVLLLSIAVLFYTGRTHEGEIVDGTKEQAVFLTNGQVYFGKIKTINTQYVDLQDIFYLNSQGGSNNNNNSTPTSFSLVKLGCELHGPMDEMIINRQQVSFWENLSTTGKVANAIGQWKSQNPNGQKCTDTTNSTQQSTGTTNNNTSTNSNAKQ